VVPKLVQHTPDQLTAILRTMSFYDRLSPGQRHALDREYQALYERLGRPIRASVAAVLVTARRLARPSETSPLDNDGSGAETAMGGPANSTQLA
ncbi:MAG TPA: hypothetical protein VKU77_02165, partial [Streptosporangiaceae bacterium]|nr:hypothetical protein [Streptosporangiaceae bacterium]